MKKEDANLIGKYYRHSGFIISSNIVMYLKSTFKNFRIVNSKGRKRMKYKNNVTSVTFVTFYTAILHKQSLKKVTEKEQDVDKSIQRCYFRCRSLSLFVTKQVDIYKDSTAFICNLAI